MVFDQLVKVLIMAPRHVDLVQTTTGLVNAVDGVEARILAVLVQGKELGENDLVREPASHRKGIANHGPLRLAKEAEHFAQVVNKAGQHKPVGVAVRLDRFRRLQQVRDLRQVDVRV